MRSIVMTTSHAEDLLGSNDTSTLEMANNLDVMYVWPVEPSSLPLGQCLPE